MSYIPAYQVFRAPAPVAAPAPTPTPAPTSKPTLAQYIAALPDAANSASESGEGSWPETQFTRARQADFLRLLAECGVVRLASARAGISYRTVYRERRASAAFAAVWDAALVAARAVAEDVLASRALDGVEEVVWFRGEEVGRRVRYDARLLLAHLARLDRMTENARAAAFAADFEGAVDRWEAGVDDPVPLCPECAAPLPLVAAPAEEASARSAPAGAEPDAGEAPALIPGPCDRCDTPAAAPAAARPAFPPCPDCGGACLGPEIELTAADCQWLGNRLDRFAAARPPAAPQPHQLTAEPGAAADAWEIECAQLAAFEEGAARWWLVVNWPAADGAWPNALAAGEADDGEAEEEGWLGRQDPQPRISEPPKTAEMRAFRKLPVCRWGHLLGTVWGGKRFGHIFPHALGLPLAGPPGGPLAVSGLRHAPCRRAGPASGLADPDDGKAP